MGIIVGLLDDSAVLTDDLLKSGAVNEGPGVDSPRYGAVFGVDIHEGPQTANQRIDIAVGNGVVGIDATERSRIFALFVFEALDGADLAIASLKVVVLGKQLVNPVK